MSFPRIPITTKNKNKPSEEQQEKRTQYNRQQ